MENYANSLFEKEPVQLMQFYDKRVDNKLSQMNNTMFTEVYRAMSDNAEIHTKEKVSGELTEKEIEKLETWKVFQKFNNFVEGTTILPCKAFLEEKKWLSHLKKPELFHIDDFLNSLDKKGLRLDLIIDLNRSFDYYNFSKLKNENSLLSKTHYKKFLLENAALPCEKELNEIYDLLKSSHEKGEIVAIHCYHGVNRTGYIVCDFICRYFGLSGEDAISRFESARGHKIEHEVMTNKLREKYPG